MASRDGLAVFPMVAAAAGAVVWYLWSHQGQGHGVTLEDHAASGMSYDCYAWWATHQETAYHRNYPQEMGPSCLPSPLQTQDGSISTRSNLESPYG